VLIGPRTASSGEAVAVALRGRPRSRSFGSPSYGQTIANTVIGLADGAAIALAVLIEVDRTGREYPSGIEPDEFVLGESFSKLADDAVVRAASASLLAYTPKVG
jgi:carboxyl-terminal processing protease